MTTYLTRGPGDWGWECTECPEERYGLARGADGFPSEDAAQEGLVDHLIEDHGEDA